MSLLQQARDKANGGDDRIAWKPTTPGEGVEGVVTAIDWREGDYKDRNGKSVEIPWVTLLSDDGASYSVVGFRAVLRDEITKAKPQISDRMAVVYKGEQKNKSGSGSYFVYSVVVAHKSQSDAGLSAADNGTSGSATASTDKPPF